MHSLFDLCNTCCIPWLQRTGDFHQLEAHSISSFTKTCADPERRNHKNKGFLSNTGPDPLKEQASIQFRAMAFHWRAGDWPAFRGIFILFPSSSYIFFLKKKTLSELDTL